LGYTFGPWEYRKHRDQDTADAYGHFVSVWQLQPDGQWKVVFDSGISHGPPSGPAVRLELGSARCSGKPVCLGPQEQREAANLLLAIDRGLSDTASAAAARDRLLSAMSDKVIAFFESHYPMSGKTAVEKMLRSDTATYRWQPERAIVSASGDLGYVYGIANSCIQEKPAGEFNYLRIWGRRPDGTWSIVVQKTEPIEK
jgi:ketosteroid isomerase-like protein